MDGKRFDRLTISLASGQSRRSVIKGLLGFGGAAAVSTIAIDEADARRSRGTRPPSPPATTTPPCPAGTESCDSNSTGCCAVCDAGTVQCGYDCCASDFQCCDGECCFPTDTCLTKAFPHSSQPEETCCPTSQTCDNQCCDGECFDPNPLTPLPSSFLRSCCPAGLTVCLNQDGTQTCIDPDTQCCADVDCTDLPDECAEPVCDPQNQCQYLVCEDDLTCCPDTSTCVLLGTDDNCSVCGDACETCENCTNGECVDYCLSGNCCSDGSCLPYNECCFDEDCADSFSCTENICEDGLCRQTNNPLNCTGLPDDICWICEPTTDGADAEGCVFNCNVDTSTCCPGCLICGSNGQCVTSDFQCGSCETCVGTDCEPVLDDFQCRDESGICCGGSCTELGTDQNCSKCGDVCDEFLGSYCNGNVCDCQPTECAIDACGPIANNCGEFNQCGDCSQGFKCENGTCVTDLSCQTDTDCDYLDDVATCKSGVCTNGTCQQESSCADCQSCFAGNCVDNCLSDNSCTRCNTQTGSCYDLDDNSLCSGQGAFAVCCDGTCTAATNANCGACEVTCSGQEICQNGSCVCIPDCTGKECGSDGCNGSCGACGQGFECGTGFLAGTCVDDYQTCPPTGNHCSLDSGTNCGVQCYCMPGVDGETKCTGYNMSNNCGECSSDSECESGSVCILRTNICAHCPEGEGVCQASCN